MSYHEYLADFDLHHGENISKNQTEPFRKAVAALQELAAVHSDEAALRAYAQAMWLRLGLAWVQANGLHRSKELYCLHDLSGEPCDRRGNCFPVAGHHSSWRRDGKPAAILAQEYALHTDMVRKLSNQIRRFDLGVKIAATTSWYFPGVVTSIIYYPKHQDMRTYPLDSGVSEPLLITD